MSFRRFQVDSELAAQIVALAPGETVTVIGRCGQKGCKHGARLDLPGITVFGPDSPHFRVGMLGDQMSSGPKAKGYTVPEGGRWIGTGGYLNSFAREDYRCPDHGIGYTFKGLKAIMMSTVVCSSACEEATGADCKCSCAGANHGMLAN